jgi:hypothetical protein
MDCSWECGKTWVDGQAAVAFELRHFPRYYELRERMLQGLKEKWISAPLSFNGRD